MRWAPFFFGGVEGGVVGAFFSPWINAFTGSLPDREGNQVPADGFGLSRNCQGYNLSTVQDSYDEFLLC